jgi:hypothetical protein
VNNDCSPSSDVEVSNVWSVISELSYRLCEPRCTCIFHFLLGGQCAMWSDLYSRYTQLDSKLRNQVSGVRTDMMFCILWHIDP